MDRTDTEVSVAPSPERRLAAALEQSGGPLALAESCTGGLVAQRVTEIPGSSAYFDRGIVVYSNRAKVELLGVPGSLLETHGAVSEECARAMIEGLFQRTPAEIAAAVTGIAGPTGGSREKPVGCVFIAWGRRGETAAVERMQFAGGRTEVRQAAAEAVLERLATRAEKSC